MTAPRPGSRATLTVAALGSAGDGLAEADGRRWFVPYALPGETVQVRVTGADRHGVHTQLEAVRESAADRAAPVCRHFANGAQACGGCRLQHLDDTRQRSFKQGLVTQALAARGLPSQAVLAPELAPLGSRRRVTLAAVGTRSGAVLGYHRRASHRVVDVGECPIARPEIVAALPGLRSALGRLLDAGERADLHLTVSDTGLAVLLIGPAVLDGAARDRLAALATAEDWAELAWQPDPQARVEPVAARRAPQLGLGPATVTIPPGAFLQASADGEAAIQRAVRAGLGAPEPGAGLADLYCGLGTVSLPLAAAGWRVAAWDGAAEALTALAEAAGAAALPVTAARRDLAARPVRASELAGYRAGVFDPPRSGARAQAAELAASDMDRVVAVSCHPGTFARDARVLVDGGLELAWVQPIDQFRFAAHVEVVAAFVRR